MNNIKTKIFESNFFKKIKNVKHIEYIILLIFVCILVLIFMSSSLVSKSSSSSVSSGSDYAAEIETKLTRVLANIKGVGSVSVMVTVDSTPKLVIATTKEIRTNSSEGSSSSTDNNTTVETPVIVTKNGSSEPLVLQEINPTIKGVLIVAEGADNVKIRLNLLSAVQSVLKIDISCIEIFSA